MKERLKRRSFCHFGWNDEETSYALPTTKNQRFFVIRLTISIDSGKI